VLLRTSISWSDNTSL